MPIETALLDLLTDTIDSLYLLLSVHTRSETGRQESISHADARIAGLLNQARTLRTATDGTRPLWGAPGENSGPAGVSVAEAFANAERNAPALKAAGEPAATLFGQPVGDGLDDERAQARMAINVLRSLFMAAGATVLHHGDGSRHLRVSRADIIITASEAALMVDLGAGER